MKKLLVSSLSVIALAILGTGCLKDKGFENQQYGTQVQDSRAVAFPQSRTAPSITLGLFAQSTSQDILGPVVSLEAPGAQSADTHITLQVNDALVTADPTLTILPASLYSLNLNRTIAAGATLDSIVIPFTSTVSLDPNLKYGIGLSIVSADNNFTVASNMKDILIVFTVKNIYDGDYTSNGYFYHPSSPRDIIDRPKTLSTLTSTSVTCELGDLGGAGYIAVFDVDASNNVTITPAAGAAGGAYTMFTAGLPTTTPGYTPQWPRSSECNNTYDPATKSFKVRYGYTGSTGYRVTEEIITKNP